MNVEPLTRMEKYKHIHENCKKDSIEHYVEMQLNKIQDELADSFDKVDENILEIKSYLGIPLDWEEYD